MKIIARIKSDFPEKFGIPRQSGLTSLVSDIVFEKEFRNIEAVRGLEGFSHLWIIWEFSEAITEEWSPTVRPPKLGGNKRMGVFATRSPYRPNPIGLSSVKILNIDKKCENAPVIRVEGADIMDNTPVYDIKPYIPYSDCRTDASGGFSFPDVSLKVDFPENLLRKIPEEKRNGLISVLGNDPRPGYQHSPDRIYTMSFSGKDIVFTVSDGILTVKEIVSEN